MSLDPFSDAKIIECWHKNARAWTKAVRGQLIESRRLCTDEAIVSAVVSCSAQSAIDVGCGEGWLCRALAQLGVDALGIDVVPGLVSAAKDAGEGDFQLQAYEEISHDTVGRRADAVVCNFSLIGKESTERMISSSSSLLNEGGSLIVQTLHPTIACGTGPYEDGWRSGSWDGFDGAFVDAAPWYFRTVESWRRLFQEGGFRLREIREPTYPTSEEAASIVFIAGLS